MRMIILFKSATLFLYNVYIRYMRTRLLLYIDLSIGHVSETVTIYRDLFIGHLSETVTIYRFFPLVTLLTIPDFQIIHFFSSGIFYVQEWSLLVFITCTFVRSSVIQDYRIFTSVIRETQCISSKIYLRHPYHTEN